MTHFLSRLAARAAGLAPTAGPRLAAHVDVTAGAFGRETEAEVDDIASARPIAPGRVPAVRTTGAPGPLAHVPPAVHAIPSGEEPGLATTITSGAGAGAVTTGPSSAKSRASAGAGSRPSHHDTAPRHERWNEPRAAPAPTRRPSVAVPALPATPPRAIPAPAPRDGAAAAGVDVDDPVVRISIGRVEVRASLVAAAQPSAGWAEERDSGGAAPMPLHDYLRGRRQVGDEGRGRR